MAVQSFLKGFGVRSSATPEWAGDVDVILVGDDKRRLELLDDFEQAAMGWLWASDAEGRLIYVSESAVEKLGVAPQDLLTQPLSKLFETDPNNPDEKSDRPFQFQLSARSKLNNLTVRLSARKFDNAGNQIWWSISGQPKFGPGGDFLGYRGSAKDISVEYARKLVDSKLAEYDSLTGLANRHRMDNRLAQTLAAYKAAKRSCALLMLDLDRFKAVNDTMGHQAGDELLRQVADRLVKSVGLVATNFKSCCPILKIAGNWVSLLKRSSIWSHSLIPSTASGQ
jgi:GGDEF domain-containing protein